VLRHHISKFQPGDQIKVISGTYVEYEGYVQATTPLSPRVQVVLNLYGSEKIVWVKENELRKITY
jgi:transcription antitermination factor NusG